MAVTSQFLEVKSVQKMGCTSPCSVSYGMVLPLWQKE